MNTEFHKEIGHNYRYFLAWRHAAFAGNIVVLGGACSLLNSAYEKSVPVAWLIPLLSALVAVCLWLADKRTRQIYHSLVEAGKALELQSPGPYNALTVAIIPKDAHFFPSKDKPLCKLYSQSFALDCFFLLSAVILAGVAIYLMIHPPNPTKVADSGSKIAAERTGVPPSTFDAHLKAAEQDYAPAQGNLGVCCELGLGVEKDYVEAYAWYNVAAKTESTSGKNRDDLEKKMTPQQIADAQKRTKELRAQIEAKLKSGAK